jgi:glycylpeptide N-tetradecanoyltransferase
MLCTDEVITTNEPIEADKPQEELRQEPYSLPAGFCWDSLDIDNPIVVSCE